MPFMLLLTICECHLVPRCSDLIYHALRLVDIMDAKRQTSGTPCHVKSVVDGPASDMEFSTYHCVASPISPIEQITPRTRTVTLGNFFPNITKASLRGQSDISYCKKIRQGQEKSKKGKSRRKGRKNKGSSGITDNYLTILQSLSLQQIALAAMADRLGECHGDVQKQIKKKKVRIHRTSSTKMYIENIAVNEATSTRV